MVDFQGFQCLSDMQFCFAGSSSGLIFIFEVIDEHSIDDTRPDTERLKHTQLMTVNAIQLNTWRRVFEVNIVCLLPSQNNVILVNSGGSFCA